MVPDQHPVVQALLGTLFTWGLTAAVRCSASGPRIELCGLKLTLSV